jgi:hypothetical protein
MPSFDKRLSLLEERVRVLKGGEIWLDMLDTKVKVIIGPGRGKEIEFPTAFQAAKYVRSWKDKGMDVKGIVFVSYIGDLFYDRPSVPALDKFLKHTAVILNLAKWVNGSLEDIAIGSWTHLHPEQAENP